jgi:hypothetical protein
MLYAYILGEAGTVMQYVQLDYIPVVSHIAVIDHATVLYPRGLPASRLIKFGFITKTLRPDPWKNVLRWS